MHDIGVYVESFTTYRAYAVKAAKELHYSEDVIQSLKNAKTSLEVQRIMAKARHDSTTYWDL